MNLQLEPYMYVQVHGDRSRIALKAPGHIHIFTHNLHGIKITMVESFP